MIIGVDPKVDYAFKRVFGDERNAEILIHLLNAILAPDDPIVSIELLNPFHEKDFTEDKLTVLDIKARDQAGRLLNIEVQLLLPRHFRGRILYYQAGLYRQQLGEGDSYGQLRPVISICLVNQSLFAQVADYHLDFRLLNERHGLCFSYDLQIHLLELPKFRRQLEELEGPLEKWLYFFQHAATLDADQLPAAFNEPIYWRAARELAMLTKNELERERYEARQKAIRDQMSLLEDAAEQGLEQGRDQGQFIGRIHLCERRLGRIQTPTDELIELSIEELGRRAEGLETELFGS